uniref:Focadhesin n=1 Tax=Hippocampus comes TaxID=109280 RepID=A0A3Q2XY33_HIPCM
MMEALKVRLDFQSPIIQVEAVRKLVAAVLREKSQTGQISLSSTQGSALETLWERCCGDCAVVRSACCDAVVLLVDQGHADPQQVLNGVLNLLPSARNVHGLVQVVAKLLQMQADRRDRDAGFTCPYGINSPHPYITALENRPDCWTAILAAIAEFVQQAVDNEPAYVAMLVPFLRYLYCQPERRSEHGFLRQGLLRTLLPANAIGAPAPQNKEREEDEDSPAFDSLLRCLCRLVPHMPELPFDELLMGVALLLFEAPAAQQSSLLSLVLPVLQLLSCSDLTEPLAERDTHELNQKLVPSLLPVLLFKLGKEKDPSLTHAVLDCLPNLGTHKQDRVYPELQRLLAQPDNRVVMGRETQWEQVLARAACLRDICREPYQHASDMLAAIALTLKQCSRDDQVTPAVLALQGLQELCRAEVVDIVSTWKSLGPELRCDSRPPMVKAVSQLLALVPQLAVKSEEYQLELFLTSLIKQETSQMPRGVYFSALRGGGLRSDQGKTMAGIPAFMLKSYEKNKQPGLKAGLAGLLLCYELPQQTDRAGRPLRRLLLSRSRSYQQTMTALIHEQVNIQPSEWHRALLLPQAWRSFMNHTFHAVLEGRRADLETQRQKDQEDAEALQYNHHYAWLDHLTDTIRGATRDSPVVQGNSILALSALAAALAKYERNLPAENDAGPEMVPTSSWLAMVLDTLLSIVSSGYKAKGQVFPWYLHRSYSGENTASAIARSCASLALSLLVPVLILWHQDGLKRVLSALRAGLPGSPTADDSQAIRFHSGLALGMVTGCVLGLALALSALCGGGPAQQRVRAVLTLDKLLSALQDSGGQGRMMQEQVLAYSVACVSVSAFSAGVIDPEKAEQVVATLRALTEESQQTPGLSMALGLAVHGLSLCGHGKAEDLQPRLLAAWLKILLAEGCPTMQRLAAVNGLVALVGSESYLIQIVSFSGAIGLQSNCACLMGHLHLSHTFASHSHAAVPPDFGYLAEKSVIRAVVDLLTEAGKKPEFAPPSVVQTALRPLASVGTAFQYPPVNWSGILSPLMRLSFEEVQHQCVALAAAQAQYSQSASLFLGSWLSSPLVYSLSSQTRALLYDNLSSWMKHVPEDKLQFFVETLGPQTFREDLEARHLSLRGSLLRGLTQAMAAPDPPSACWAALSSATEKIFGLLPDTEVDYYVGVADCLSEMSDTEIDRIAGVTEVSKRMEWLLELMGLIRNVAYGATADSTDFLFQVFAAAVVSWGDLSVPLLLGVRWRWFPWSTASKPAALTHALYGAESLTEGALPRCLLGLPRSLPPLLHKEPWNRHAHKFIEWLLSLVEGPEQSLSAATVDAARALLALRSSPEFKKKSVWTRAYGW